MPIPHRDSTFCTLLGGRFQNLAFGDSAFVFQLSIHMTTRIHPSVVRSSAPTLSEQGAFCRVRRAAFAGLAVSAALVAAPGTHAAAPSLPTGAQTVAGPRPSPKAAPR
ncbi:MAG: hypothetical protein DVB28_001519 [Verrucomicrobia bacterium]|nr:MAG: hypothetical protein DVB28_001519 [Verrucomicrobiota bacterium]